MATELIDRLATRQEARLSIAKKANRGDVARANAGENDVSTSIDSTAVGHRLRRLRETLGLTRAEMADANHIDRTNWGRFEDGKRLITTDVAYRLKRRYGITFDWLYDGDVGSLPVSLAERLRQFS